MMGSYSLEEILLVLMSLLALPTLIYAISRARAEKRLAPIYIWLGGGLVAYYYESAADQVVHGTYHEVQHLLIWTFDHQVPIWIYPTYIVAVAGPVLWNMYRIKTGVTMKSWMISYFVLALGCAGFEIPLIAAGAFEYYGLQPFSIGGFPLVMGFSNAAGFMFTNAVILHAIDRSVIGQRWPWLYIFLVPVVTAGAHASVALPWGHAVNSTAGQPIVELLGAVSMLVGVFQAWLCGKLVCVPNKAHQLTSTALQKT